MEEKKDNRTGNPSGGGQPKDSGTTRPKPPKIVVNPAIQGELRESDAPPSRVKEGD